MKLIHCKNLFPDSEEALDMCNNYNIVLLAIEFNKEISEKVMDIFLH